MAWQKSAKSEKEQTVSTAVALNYCRASFHRIRRYPFKRVLLEEQEHILNNLNLNRIADADVIRLYTAVIVEINDVQIADKERKVIDERHKRVFRKQLVINAYHLGLELASAQYLKALKLGARSWWDYRSMTWNRQLDQWQVDKSRIAAVVNKSAQFLDTFWKLARERKIPDKWLLRSTDLDKLEKTLQENDPTVRLRVLKRMQPFMECYPPYWYYLARTQQSLGQLFAAAKTYEKLEEVGKGHFRKDQMMAAGMANRAAIQDYLNQPSAAKTARLAMKQSTDVWEVNLLCASILDKHGFVEEAEDAILRNLDVDLEQRQSLGVLISIYCRHKNLEKLRVYFADPRKLSQIPAYALCSCALQENLKGYSKIAADFLHSSIEMKMKIHWGPEDIEMKITSNWDLNQARISLLFGTKEIGNPKIERKKDGRYRIEFPRLGEFGKNLQSTQIPAQILAKISYAQGADLFLIFGRSTDTSIPRRRQNVGLLAGSGLTTRVPYDLVTISMGGKSVSLLQQPNVSVEKKILRTHQTAEPERKRNRTKTVSPPLPQKEIEKPESISGLEYMPIPPRSKTDGKKTNSSS